MSVNELRAERKGEAPKRHRGTMFSLEEAATYDQLLAGFKQQTGIVSDREALLELMRRGASGEGGEATVQRIVINECGTCGEATSQTREGPIPVSRAAVEHARCSGEVHDLREEQNVVKRAIPAAVRRRVIDRDGRRCLVPGCGAMAALDVHHEDGWRNGHDPARMLTLCWWHHRLRHKGLLKIEGAAPNFRFLLADVTSGKRGSSGDTVSRHFSYAKTAPPESKSSDAEQTAASRAKADAALALQGLEMKKREAKRWVEVALAGEPGRAWTAEDLVRAALRHAN